MYACVLLYVCIYIYILVYITLLVHSCTLNYLIVIYMRVYSITLYRLVKAPIYSCVYHVCTSFKTSGIVI